MLLIVNANCLYFNYNKKARLSLTNRVMFYWHATPSLAAKLIY